MADSAGPASTRPVPASATPTQKVVDLTTEEAVPKQNGAPKPVFKMKRTGLPTLPGAPDLWRPPRNKSPSLSPAFHLPRPTQVTPKANGHDPDPEPAQIVSDILPPTAAAPSTPTLDSMSAPTGPKPSPASDGTRKTKYATDEERRKATGLALKQRWASGIMDNVHKKRLETIRRNKEAALLGTSSAVKSPGPTGIIKHAQKTPGTPRRLAATSNDHARKRSLVSEQLARYLDDKPTPAVPATPVDGRGATSSEKHETTDQPSSPASDVEMPDTEPTNPREGSIDSELAEDSLFPSHSDSGQKFERLEYMTGNPPKSLDKTSSGRAYTKVKDKKGGWITTYGALMPEGYRLSTTTPQRPWTCPVRSCRKAFPEILRLGSHFVRAHRGAVLHDNEDGTFSVRGIYAPLRRENTESSRRQPAIVVSQGSGNLPLSSDVIPSLETVEDGSVTNSTTPSEKKSQALAETEPDGTGEALWSYLQPHLIKHKGPIVPAKGWVLQLITLPRLRELDWNTPWLAEHPFHDSQPRDVSAAIIQVTGDPAQNPCVRCLDGKGPFKSCVMISAKAHRDPLQTIISCANCFYHYRQTYCTHKEWGLKRAQKILSARAGELSDDDSLEQDTPDSTVKDEVMEDMDGSAAESFSAMDSIPAGITEAEPGRPYDMWPDDNGSLGILWGALLPSGYQLDATIPNRPWVCPVRTCRKAFVKRSDLGFHFARVHFAALLNDNGDGSFSIKGVYQSKQANVGKGGKILNKAPPIVVSKEPLGRNDSTPLPKAELPYYLARTSIGGVEDGDILQPQETTPSGGRAGSSTKNSTRGGLRSSADASLEVEEMEVDGSEGSKAADTFANGTGLRSARRPEVKSQAPSSHQPAPSSLISPGTFHAPAALLEMEDWEVAPGRIRETAATEPETIAFSKAYLSATSQAVPVCDDVAFRVDTVHSGSTLRLEPDANATRLCSVAAGKVRVKIGDEAEFAVGPHGMFKVKAGVVCAVRNGLYLDAVLHTVVLQGF